MFKSTNKHFVQAFGQEFNMCPFKWKEKKKKYVHILSTIYFIGNSNCLFVEIMYERKTYVGNVYKPIYASGERIRQDIWKIEIKFKWKSNG